MNRESDGDVFYKWYEGGEAACIGLCEIMKTDLVMGNVNAPKMPWGEGGVKHKEEGEDGET